MHMYILKGKQVVETDDINELNKFFADDELRRVNLTKLGNFVISTVFLTVDHGFNGVPLFFETGVNHGDWDIVDRYSTYEQAEVGHRKTVEIYREKAIQNLVEEGMSEENARNQVMVEEVFEN